MKKDLSRLDELFKQAWNNNTIYFDELSPPCTITDQLIDKILSNDPTLYLIRCPYYTKFQLKQYENLINIETNLFEECQIMYHKIDGTFPGPDTITSYNCPNPKTHIILCYFHKKITFAAI